MKWPERDAAGHAGAIREPVWHEESVESTLAYLDDIAEPLAHKQGPRAETQRAVPSLDNCPNIASLTMSAVSSSFRAHFGMHS